MTSTYGICNLSVVPVRVEPSDKAEIGTQLLFGDAFSVLKYSRDEKWVYIQIAYDNYMGWIDFKQYKSVPKEYYELINSTEFPLCNQLIGLVQGEKKFFPILMGTSLPFFKNGTIVLDNEIYQFEGEIYYPKKNNDYKFLENIAHNFLNAPYLWGGKNHFGIDCSGFVQQVFRFAGYKLPRDAYQQAECGINVRFSDIKAGDLAFFSNSEGRVVHVGIILKNFNIIHASGQVRVDIFDPKGIFNGDRQIYSHKLASIKRILA
jgi:gamma-D-glutamyl-L-lysine dipeptidyl-peptidase